MGGFGSGARHFKKTKVEDCHRLEINRLKQWGSLRPGASGVLTWSIGDRQTGSIGYSTQDDRMVLRFRICAPGSADWQSVEQRIDLEATPCHFGGLRQWFACPGCRQRVGVLHLYHSRFLCRRCHGLTYQSQSASEYDRLVQKANRLRARIGSETRKPKGMYWATYQRLQQRYDEAKTAANQGLYDRITKLEQMTTNTL